MKSSTKIATGLAAIAAAFGVYKAVAFFRKAADLVNQITVNVTPRGFSLVNITTAKATLTASLTNYSGINLTVTNVFTKLYLLGTDGVKTEVGRSNVSDKLTFSNNQTKSFDLAFNISYLTIVGQILTGKAKQIQVVTYYDFKSQRLQYASEVDITAFVSKAKAFVSGGNNTVQGAGVGYL